jgi:hypothetical protein
MTIVLLNIMKTNAAVSYTSFVLAFAYFVLFNLFDLSSTILALRLGLSEANFALLYLTSSLGLSITDAIVLVKSVFFVGIGGMMILGIATRSTNIRKTILATIIIFCAVFAIVSVSNFISIFTIISA